MDISVINRRVFLAPALPIDKRKNDDADVKKLLPTLDIGSHINARRQARLKAGARHERTLAAVACTPWLGATRHARHRRRTGIPAYVPQDLPLQQPVVVVEVQDAGGDFPNV